MKTDKPADQPLVEALVAIFSLGSELAADDQTLQVLRAIRRLRPQLHQLALVEAQQLVEARDLAGARLLLEDLDARQPDNAMVKAMMAMVLQQQRDGLWQAFAQDARALPPDPRAQVIIDSLDRISRGAPYEGPAEDALPPSGPTDSSSSVNGPGKDPGSDAASRGESRTWVGAGGSHVGTAVEATDDGAHAAWPMPPYLGVAC